MPSSRTNSRALIADVVSNYGSGSEGGTPAGSKAPSEIGSVRSMRSASTAKGGAKDKRGGKEPQSAPPASGGPARAMNNTLLEEAPKTAEPEVARRSLFSTSRRLEVEDVTRVNFTDAITTAAGIVIISETLQNPGVWSSVGNSVMIGDAKASEVLVPLYTLEYTPEPSTLECSRNGKTTVWEVAMEIIRNEWDTRADARGKETAFDEISTLIFSEAYDAVRKNAAFLNRKLLIVPNVQCATLFCAQYMRTGIELNGDVNMSEFGGGCRTVGELVPEYAIEYLTIANEMTIGYEYRIEFDCRYPVETNHAVPTMLGTRFKIGSFDNALASIAIDTQQMRTGVIRAYNDALMAVHTNCDVTLKKMDSADYVKMPTPQIGTWFPYISSRTHFHLDSKDQLRRVGDYINHLRSLQDKWIGGVKQRMRYTIFTFPIKPLERQDTRSDAPRAKSRGRGPRR